MKITLILSELEVKILENDLLDIRDWFENAKDGKINNCKKRLMQEWQQKLMKDPDIDNIPASEEGFIKLIISQPNYKNRVKREKEEGKLGEV